MKEKNLLLVRHGQSEWNEKNLFTGWENPGLTKKGEDEARNAGLLIKKLGINFDYMFTSDLIRAQLTASMILNKINQNNIPTIKNKALNERFYGDLQGLNKDECRKKWGEEKVQMWRRSYNLGPPGGETLKETGERVIPYFKKEIQPLLETGKNIIIAAHGNSLRSLIKFLDDVSDDDIVKLEIPTGAPIHYAFNEYGNVIKNKIL
ncbi:MAG: 2,3-bisphosphoglycerate-dependent phosphoglycerate mutase [Gammaproteobacteria bacterium]|nr:2,3-bisphosphoglycerate-dependent phosphoglycerate mutase [Gammaproteobacteria bacterium]|tara:strand:- start:1820 stop:2437 length:618 start_codon:yes stop_codon:yes gene_type:complete